jgi:hypothetical protein
LIRQLSQREYFGNKLRRLLRALKSGMDPALKLSRHLTLRILRALSRIRKPRTVEEITELLNRELDSDDRPFRSKEVAELLSRVRGYNLETVLAEESSP